MRHDYYSDLILTASCDVQCDGTPEASVDLLDRPRLNFSHSSFTCTNSYVFSDRALAGVLCRTMETAGCYLPTLQSDARPALRAAFPRRRDWPLDHGGLPSRG